MSGGEDDERQVLLSRPATALRVPAENLGRRMTEQTIIADPQCYGRSFERELAEGGVRFLCPGRSREAERPSAHLFKPLRRTIKSIDQTFKGQLDLERHGGRALGGVTVRIFAKVLALVRAIWHNDDTGEPIKRSLTRYDH
ncbi:hypothetical protein ACU635_51690 [[Actinomadura] parvosata]|uniref:hypothetical protein n=1 Tax=[Actinomadura] parvosata TaxID=1955412 RepID=UPI00406CA82D